MTFAFSSGTISAAINQTGKAGLSFATSISSSGLSVTASGIPGDANLDGTVNATDFNLLAGHFNQTSQNWLTGDFNGDGVVNASDFDLLAANYGTSLQPAAPWCTGAGTLFGVDRGSPGALVQTQSRALCDEPNIVAGDASPRSVIRGLAPAATIWNR